MGGKATIPLCSPCHAKVHGAKSLGNSALTKMGMERARKAGKQIGRVRKYDYAAIARWRKQGKTCLQISKLIGATKDTVTSMLARLRKNKFLRSGKKASTK